MEDGAPACPLFQAAKYLWLAQVIHVLQLISGVLSRLIRLHVISHSDTCTHSVHVNASGA